MRFQISNFELAVAHPSAHPPRLRGELEALDSQTSFPKLDSLPLKKAVLTLLLLLAAVVVCNAQDVKPSDELVVDGRQAGDVFGMGRSVRVRGDVRGVIAFGGDVIVEGRVEGDAAAIGGSVIQLGGSHIGGDVMIFGGTYRREEGAGRSEGGKTVMVAGYEQELRGLARNPASLLAPELSLKFLGLRLLAVLFWFVASVALTAVSPGAVARAAARLQLTFRHVLAIGLVGALVMGPGVTAALRFLPPAVGALVGVTALLLVLLSYLFGRVVIHAATGRWLQRLFLSESRRSESVALLLGAAFWALVLALPYVWPFLVLGLVVLSLGLALTARYRLGWRRA
ncbi:MAG TPA: polymer-forming cytoskeletal protein [Pyrinomonadaceae bacterium]